MSSENIKHRSECNEICVIYFICACGNLPQSYRQANSLLRSQSYRRPNFFHHSRTDKHTPWSTDATWRAQAVFIHCSSPLGCLNFNTGASQPASATSAPPPIGSRSAQRKWNKIRASAGQVSESTSTTQLSTRECHISLSVPVRPAEHSDQQYHQQPCPRREFITAAALTGVGSNSMHHRQSTLPM
jgi:hypothetical protein